MPTVCHLQTVDLKGFSYRSYKNTRTTQKASDESQRLFVNEAPIGHEVASLMKK